MLDTVRRYEYMVRQQETVFFDLEDFENIIDHYVTNTRFEEALQACEAALELYPFSTELLIDRAQVTAMRGDYAEAERQIDHVASLDPDNADVAVTRGIISTQRGDFAEAVAFFKEGLAQYSPLSGYSSTALRKKCRLSNHFSCSCSSTPWPNQASSMAGFSSRAWR